MRLKEKWVNFCCKMLYCFKPLVVILTSLIFMLFIDAGCAIVMLLTGNETVQDILFAILTGVTASVLVAVIVEMANNYQRNNKRWLQLSPLFSALTHYEQEVEIKTGHFDSEKAHLDFTKNLHEEMVKKGAETRDEAAYILEETSETFDESTLAGNLPLRDRLQCVFDKLPKLIPLIEDAYENHSDDFRRVELEPMRVILDNYRQIKDIVSITLMEQSTLLFGKDPKTPGDLVEWLPKRLKKDLNESTLLHLAMDVWETERERIAETLMRQGAVSLESIGITIGDGVLAEGDAIDEHADNEYEEVERDNAFGQIISQLVGEIDRELIQLQRIIKSEPGFKIIFSYFQHYSARYKR